VAFHASGTTEEQQRPPLLGGGHCRVVSTAESIDRRVGDAIRDEVLGRLNEIEAYQRLFSRSFPEVRDGYSITFEPPRCGPTLCLMVPTSASATPAMHWKAISLGETCRLGRRIGMRFSRTGKLKVSS
jgi:hypothetical protein